MRAAMSSCATSHSGSVVDACVDIGQLDAPALPRMHYQIHQSLQLGLFKPAAFREW